jgi:hypothetical protein
MKRYGLILGTLLCIAAITPVKAASVGLFDGKPMFAQGEGFGYYVWRDGNTWHLRWTTFGSMHRFSGSVIAEGGKIDSLKRVDVETERRVIAPGRAPRVVRGPRGRVRGVAPGRAPIVETRDQDHIDKEGDHQVVFNTRTNDDIDGFDFKVDKGVDVLRLSLQIDGESRTREIEVGRANAHVTADPIVIDLR